MAASMACLFCEEEVEETPFIPSQVFPVATIFVSILGTLDLNFYEAAYAFPIPYWETKDSVVCLVNIPLDQAKMKSWRN